MADGGGNALKVPQPAGVRIAHTGTAATNENAAERQPDTEARVLVVFLSAYCRGSVDRGAVLISSWRSPSGFVASWPGPSQYLYGDGYGLSTRSCTVRSVSDHLRAHGAIITREGSGRSRRV
jgi:hypothetical protein